MYQGSARNKQHGGIAVGNALLDALASPGLRVAAKQRAAVPGRDRATAADATAGEEARRRGGKRKQGVHVDLPDVSKEGRHVTGLP